MIQNSLVVFLMSRGGGIFRFSAKKAHVVSQRGIWVHASFYDHSTVLSPYSAPNGVLCSPHIARSHVSGARHGAPGDLRMTTFSSTPLKPKECQVSGDSFQNVAGHPFQLRLWVLVWDPSRDDRRAMDRGFKFPDQGVAVIDLEALVDFEHLDPLSGQSTTDAPFRVPDFQLALAVDLEHPGPVGIMPARRAGIIAPLAGRPTTRWSLHVQGFMRTQVVVFPAITIQPMLGRLAIQSTLVERALQRAVKALHLALRLRMSDAAPVQPYALFHQPQCQTGAGSRRPCPTPPRHSVIHQHRLRHPALLKRLLQPLSHR